MNPDFHFTARNFMGNVIPGCWQLWCKISKDVSQNGESQIKHLDEQEGKLELR
jgi:hypothetical protein